MNLSVLKTLGFWIATAVALLGVLVSQHVVVDDSLAATIVGWLMTLLGSASAGHQNALAPTEPPPAA